MYFFINLLSTFQRTSLTKLLIFWVPVIYLLTIVLLVAVLVVSVFVLVVLLTEDFDVRLLFIGVDGVVGFVLGRIARERGRGRDRHQQEETELKKIQTNHRSLVKYV